ncbi:hypothetical protein D9M68_631110 [compost metagenome]
MPLELLHDLAVAAPVETLYQQCAFRLQVGLRKLKGQIAQVLDPGRIGGGHTGQIGGHVGDNKVNLVAARGLQHDIFELAEDFFLAEIALNKSDVGDSLHWQDIDRHHRAIDPSVLGAR